jgi:hypothetical protein
MPDKLVHSTAGGDQPYRELIIAAKFFSSVLYVISLLGYSYAMLVSYSYIGFPVDLLSRVSFIFPSVYLLYCLCSILIPMSKRVVITLAVIFNLPLVAVIIYFERQEGTFLIIPACYVLLSTLICGARLYARNVAASI